MTQSVEVDVLCVGHACYDLVFSVPKHPAADEKIFANQLVSCGGGPAANAAVAIALLGFKSAFAGYLGTDIYGELHQQELHRYGVDTQWIIRATQATPLSIVMVKPNGQRALINYKGQTQPLAATALDFSALQPKVILFDGHEPYLSMPLADYARKQGIPTVLDAGSVHDGTLAMMGKVDYLVCSEKFAEQFTGDPERMLARLARVAPTVVITLGERGLIWRHQQQQGRLAAFPVTAIDTTGAGDAFHGAFAAALASGQSWLEVLRYASAAGALCCTKMGARLGLPTRAEHEVLLRT
jgi:sulfofructose kinase